MDDGSGERLRQAASVAQDLLARLTASAAAEDTPIRRGVTLYAMAERLYAQRRARDAHFPSDLFGEPAWDLLLALFMALQEGRELGAAEACGAAGLDPLAGRPLLARVEATGLIERTRTGVKLTSEGVERMTDYLTRLI
jgi:hypothetical protein